MVQNTTQYIECTIYEADGVTKIESSSLEEMQFGVVRYGSQSNTNSVLISKTLIDGITEIEPGTYKIKLSPADTLALVGKMQFEIRVKELEVYGGDEFVATTGIFVILPKST